MQVMYNTLRDWLIENMPVTPIEQKSLNFLTRKDREKRLQQKVNSYREKAKLAVEWRNSLSDRLLIKDEDIIKATNTILEMIEGELSKGHRVKIAHFGDFKTKVYSVDGIETKGIMFRPVEDWQREINTPLYQSEIGLKRKLSKKKLERRQL